MIYRCTNSQCETLWTRIRQYRKVQPNRARHRICPDCLKYEVWKNEQGNK